MHNARGNFLLCHSFILRTTGRLGKVLLHICADVALQLWYDEGMFQSNFGDAIETVFIFGLIVVTFFGVKIENYRRKKRAVRNANTPILLAYYTHGAQLTTLQQGKIGDLHYTAILASNDRVSQAVNAGTTLLFRIELPYASSLHLLGIPKHNGTSQLDPTSEQSVMERVELEGDYPDRFNLFCEKGMQTQTRHALDPKAMVFTLDFCQSHSWEIVGNELYFVQEDDAKSNNDPTLMYDDIAAFVEQIRPAVQLPLSPQQLQSLAPYGKDRRNDLQCPLCSKTLHNNDDYYACPDGHGYLLTGSGLGKVKNGKLTLEGNHTKSNAIRTDKLVCPSCGSTMKHVNYTGSPILIDSCPDCPYRWLDSGELQIVPT